jgi:hypothetical protein
MGVSLFGVWSFRGRKTGFIMHQKYASKKANFINAVVFIQISSLVTPARPSGAAARDGQPRAETTGFRPPRFAVAAASHECVCWHDPRMSVRKFVVAMLRRLTDDCFRCARFQAGVGVTLATQWYRLGKIAFALSLPQVLGAMCCTCMSSLPPPGYTLLPNPNAVIHAGDILDLVSLDPLPANCLNGPTPKSGSSADESGTFDINGGASIIAHFKTFISGQASASAAQSVAVTATGVTQDTLASAVPNLATCNLSDQALADALYVQAAHRANQFNYELKTQANGTLQFDYIIQWGHYTRV